MLELRIHGRGGQGVVTLAELLAKGALKAGKEAQTMPFFGVERRGAAVKACVRIAEEPILLRSMSYQPGYIALMHGNMLPYAKLEGFGQGEGQEAAPVFIINGKEPVEVAAEQWLVDGEGIAEEQGLVFGGEAYINVPMLGAVARVMGLPLEDIEAAIREQWPGQKAQPNLAAAQKAYGQVKRVDGAKSIKEADGAKNVKEAESGRGRQ